MTHAWDENQLTRRDLLGASAGLGVGALASMAGLSAPADAAQAKTRPPNIVLILADDLGYGGLGAYGQKTLKTPNLDRIASEGIRFTQGYSSAPCCAPSRWSLLTGVNTGKALVRDNNFTLDPSLPLPTMRPEDTTIAETLKAAGYVSGAYGKWGFGSDDAYVGAGSSNIAPDGCQGTSHPAPYVDGKLGANADDPSHPLQQGFDDFVGLVTHDHATEGYFPTYLWHGNQRVTYPENFNGVQKTYAPDVYVPAAIDFIKKHKDQPFFVYLAPQLVHWPCLVPSTAAYDDEDWPDDVKRYAAQYTYLDQYVGEVFKALEESGLVGETLVIFTSDNGPTPAEHALRGSGACSDNYGPSPDTLVADTEWNTAGGLRGDKYALYDGGIKIPLIAWGPGIVRTDGEAVADQPWQSVDLLPTFADLAGVAPPADISGVSVRGWITGESSVKHPPLYWERPIEDQPAYSGDPFGPFTYAEAGRDGNWKAIRYAVGGNATTPDDQWLFELYDVHADPGETVNRALAHPDVRAKFEAFFDASHKTPTVARAPYAPAKTGKGWKLRLSWKTEPLLRGTAKAGGALKVSPGTVNLDGAQISWTWHINGRPLRHFATKPLKLARALRGRRVTVTVVAKKKGFGSIARTLRSRRVSG